MFTGAAKQRDWLRELALFTAWHMAAFGHLAQGGRLRDWAVIRKEFRQLILTETPKLTEPKPSPRQSWQAQKMIVATFIAQHRRPPS